MKTINFASEPQLPWPGTKQLTDWYRCPGCCRGPVHFMYVAKLV